MKSTNTIFKLLFLLLLFIFLVNIKVSSTVEIGFNQENFAENNASTTILESGKYKVGRDIVPGFYDVQIPKGSIVNSKEINEDLKINNFILNDRDVLIINTKKGIALNPAKTISWNQRLVNGTYIANEDIKYKFFLSDPTEHSSARININDDFVELEINNIEQTISIKEGDLIQIDIHPDTSLEGEKL